MLSTSASADNLRKDIDNLTCLMQCHSDYILGNMGHIEVIRSYLSLPRLQMLRRSLICLERCTT